MRVLITGATGMIGQDIVKLCHKQGVQVSYLTTRKSAISLEENYHGFYWNPKTKEIDTNCFKDVDAIIHLAASTIAKRWTPCYKKEILRSRTESTKLLVNNLKGETHNIKQVISASAIGVYPDSITNYYDEKFKVSQTSFLSKVVCAWEHEVDDFKSLGITVAKIRIGLVLSSKGGVLQKMVKPIDYGVGAAFGTGKQWQSWIHQYDLTQLFYYVLKFQLEGVYNAVSPNPVTNNELVKTIAKVLEIPLFLPNIPKFVMNLALGKMHTLLYESQRVSSKKIEDKGFFFKFHHLEPALADLL
ncbi:TIGR01777 family oxidoreductase [Tamlana sp. 2_MG-2023]|uniref:TIGR01777 family oxidoreductase n=1 Tax=unclassified Tamlana TaxID=2614803 RepID=UPI0026E4308C|nr:MULTISPECIES: TIGR01777 family oxidoreductase [unclassified Tamlana]MDO6759040.1 TIGR01777 family oxidoreductase [Tamlana sp. 2_MG-2023]MDO6789739.1 TIGR01777 family oxidoreductase [Tamlana sp. 1_MG-2023]